MRTAADSEFFRDRLMSKVQSVRDLFLLLCTCHLLVPGIDPVDDVPEHFWACPAGAFTYWCSRHPEAVIEWLGAYESGATDPAPQPRV